MLNKFCKESKIILFASWILAFIILLAGGISSCSSCAGDEDDYPYNSTQSSSQSSSQSLTASNLSLGSASTKYAKEAFYKFKTTYASSYTITVDCDDYCDIYLSANSSISSIKDDYIVKKEGYGGTISGQYLSSNTTYYIYIKVSNSNYSNIQTLISSSTK